MQYRTKLRYVDAQQYSGSNLEDVKAFVAPRLVTQLVGQRIEIDGLDFMPGQFIVLDGGELSRMNVDNFVQEYEAVES